MNSRESRTEAMISRIDECLDEYEQWVSRGRIRLDLRPAAPVDAEASAAPAKRRTRAAAGNGTRPRK